jgi:hypothetical protein
MIELGRADSAEKVTTRKAVNGQSAGCVRSSARLTEAAAW